MKDVFTKQPGAELIIAADIKREKEQAERAEREAWREYWQDRSRAATQHTLGQIVLGEEALATVIPCDLERLIWKLFHKRVMDEIGGPIKIQATNSDGSPGFDHVYFPAVVKEYLLQLARNAALLHGDDADAVAVGGEK